MLLRLVHSRRYSVSGDLDYEGNVHEIKVMTVFETRPPVDNSMGLTGVQCNNGGLEPDFTLDRSVFLI